MKFYSMILDRPAAPPAASALARLTNPAAAPAPTARASAPLALQARLRARRVHGARPRPPLSLAPLFCAARGRGQGIRPIGERTRRHRRAVPCVAPWSAPAASRLPPLTGPSSAFPYAACSRRAHARHLLAQGSSGSLTHANVQMCLCGAGRATICAPRRRTLFFATGARRAVVTLFFASGARRALRFARRAFNTQLRAVPSQHFSTTPALRGAQAPPSLGEKPRPQRWGRGFSPWRRATPGIVTLFFAQHCCRATINSIYSVRDKMTRLVW